MNYCGEILRKAEPLAWDLMRPALPPKAYCASVDVMQLCDGPMREILGDPELTLKDASERTPLPRAGKVHAEAGEIVLIGRGLLEYGLMGPVEPEEIPVVDGEPLLHGTFGVGKGKCLDAPESKWHGAELLRWIQNLQRSNSVSRML